MTRHVAIIPARGGSKRISRKNIKPFCGKPMIAWSIDAARQSGCFDRVIVSTDDVEIADLARDYGAEIPSLRPAELSDDYTGTTQVIGYEVQKLLAEGIEVAAACCLYATAPFVRAQDLAQAFQMLVQPFQYVFSATTFAFPIQRAIKLTENGGVEMFSPEHFSTRSQDLEEAYHDAGQFYWGRADAWLRQERVFAPHSRPFILPRHRVQDIDTPEDWRRAELMFSALEQENAQ